MHFMQAEIIKGASKIVTKFLGRLVVMLYMGGNTIEMNTIGEFLLVLKSSEECVWVKSILVTISNNNNNKS